MRLTGQTGEGGVRACLLEGVVAQGKAPRGSPPGHDRQPPGNLWARADHTSKPRPAPSAVRPNQRRGLAPRLPAPHPTGAEYRPRPDQFHHRSCARASALQHTSNCGGHGPLRIPFPPPYVASRLSAQRPIRAPLRGPCQPPPHCGPAAGWRDVQRGLRLSHAGAAAAVPRQPAPGKPRAALPAGRAPRRLRPRGAAGRPGEAAARPGPGRAGPAARLPRALSPRDKGGGRARPGRGSLTMGAGRGAAHSPMDPGVCKP